MRLTNEREKRVIWNVHTLYTTLNYALVFFKKNKNPFFTPKKWYKI